MRRILQHTHAVRHAESTLLLYAGLALLLTLLCARALGAPL